MKKKIVSMVGGIFFMMLFVCSAQGAELSQVDTPDYKVAFYASNNYHMEDSKGKKTGYGYEMMEEISNYMQCTFSYVGYDKTPQECVEMLRNGEIDIYTAAKITPERQKEFAISVHPAITATTCMNRKVGNTDIVAGDYDTYDGIRVGMQKHHTYNDDFIAFAKEKGFSCRVLYYDTPTELANALINGEVDASVSSYIRIPEDEDKIEDFGETPYYIIMRKEDQAVIDDIDAAFDAVNKENPGWRENLYNKYYGHQESNWELTEEEQKLLEQWKKEGRVICGVLDPDGAPYSWYEKGDGQGITADIFRETAKKLGLKCQIMPVETKEEYRRVISAGEADIWIDLHDYYTDSDTYRYKMTDSYLTSNVSILRRRGGANVLRRLVIEADETAIREIAANHWPDAEIILANSLLECQEKVLEGTVDGAILPSYTAQKLVREDVQNRLHADIVSEASLNIKMGVNADVDVRFYGIWHKTLCKVAEDMGPEVMHAYAELSESNSMAAYIFDHPVYFVCFLFTLFLVFFFVCMYLQSTKSKREQEKISKELAAALEDAREAQEVKQDFFSKMSHDIRTPLNVVLGMTQIAQKCKHDEERLDNALHSIHAEGNYLLMLVNSILDVNQLEHGHVELLQEPFDLVDSMETSVEILKSLAEEKEQNLTVRYDFDHKVVVGDARRFSQIVINVMSNAIKYTPVGGNIQVRLEALPENRYRFVCADDGIGMSEDYIKHVCEEYSRAEDSRVSKIEGTGLGMAVVKGFTDLMQGTLRIESCLGKGSTFLIEIPFADASEEQCRKVLTREVEEKETLRVAGKKVLLMEDNSLNAEIAKELLENIGFIVELAEDGEKGYERYLASEVGEFFVIFMDVQMPVMDGVETTRAIRGSQRKDCDIPIFAMTANMFSTDRKKYKEAGMTGYIAKPVSLKNIIKVLEEELGSMEKE